MENYIKNRHIGPYGGRYVPEMLIPALDELEEAYNRLKNNKEFQEELNTLFTRYNGRPTPLYFAENLTKHFNGPKIYLKLESLNHTGAHKINNAIGQGLLAKYLGKTTIIAETGAGQHGVATATIAAKLGLKCKIFMGEVDIKRQYPNVYSMKLLGAEVIPVKDGTKTLKDAVNAALKYWIEHLEDTHYLLGSALGPYPYPIIVRDFQSVIGKETKQQILEYEGKLPNALVACVGGGSNSIGLFYPFLDDKEVELYGAEAGGKSLKIGENAARFGNENPKVGIVQGYKSYFLLDEYGQVEKTHSISAGLDYPGIGPELAYLHDINRIKFYPIFDNEALEAFKLTAQKEGIIPALESSHALALAFKIIKNYSQNDIVVINISGRGDKDLFITAKALDKENWIEFLNNEVKDE